VGVKPVVVAVDGGGSKTDVVALTLDGELVGRSRGRAAARTTSGCILSRPRRHSCLRGGRRRVVVRAGLYLSGLDLAREVSDYRRAVAGCPGHTGLDVDNDCSPCCGRHR